MWNVSLQEAETEASANKILIENINKHNTVTVELVGKTKANKKH